MDNELKWWVVFRERSLVFLCENLPVYEWGAECAFPGPDVDKIICCVGRVGGVHTPGAVGRGAGSAHAQVLHTIQNQT